jgi:hypothetical protein
MNIQTKYSVNDIVIVSKQVFCVRRISIEVGLHLFRFDCKQVSVHYSIYRPDRADYCKVPEFLITKKATIKDWIKAGGKTKPEEK